MTDSNTRALAALPKELHVPQVPGLIKYALGEDLSPDGRVPRELAAGDVTSSVTVDANTTLTGRIFAKQDGVVAGLPVAAAVFRFVNESLKVETLVKDGERVKNGQPLMRVTGPGRELLIAERPALNFLGRMSGIATLTRDFVDEVEGTRATILDTRKTLPGFRALDKYAVRKGGGANHRMGLYDMAMIKDNHIDGAGGLSAAVARLRGRFGAKMKIELEVKDLDELAIALALPVDRIMLDNMSNEDMAKAVALAAERAAEEGRERMPLEASGNVSLATVKAIAQTGVDYISSGALTHSVPVFDVSMRLEAGSE